MKILHIIDSLEPGGTQTVVKGILEAHPDRHRLYLLSLRAGRVQVVIDHQNVAVHPSSSKYSFLPMLELIRLIKKEKIQILHCHLFRSQVFGWLLKLLFFPKIVLIQHEHGRIFEDSLLYACFIRLSRFRTDLFIGVSNSSGKKLVESGVFEKGKVRTLFNFVDLGRFDRNLTGESLQDRKRSLGIGGDAFTIGFVGRLSREKGCDNLLRALLLLKFEYRAVIAGDGPQKNDLIALTKVLGVDQKVIFLGHVEDIEHVYPLFDVLVVPSLNESFGLSCIEGQAAGVPVIASDIPGLNETIADTECGLLFQPKNLRDLASKISMLNGNRDFARRLTENGRKHAAAYSIDNYLNALDKIYLDLAALRNRF